MSTSQWSGKAKEFLFFFFLFLPHVSVSMYFTPPQKKNQHFSPLYCPTSHSRKAEEKYQKEKDRCCNTADFSLLKLKGSIPPKEQISPNPFPRVDLGIVFSWGLFGQSKSGGQMSTGMEKTSLGSWDHALTLTNHTLLCLVLLLSFITSLPAAEKPSAAFLILHQDK